jgi:hypothetical protein
MEPMKMEIDKRYRNSETGGYFEQCLVCYENVLENEKDYFIEKIIRRIKSLNLTEVLFEYAICMDCAQDMRKKISKHSMVQMETFFHKNARLHERNSEELETQKTTEKCLFTGKSIAECDEFSLHAHCNGKEMILSLFPYAVSDDAMDTMSELLSAETLDELDRFKKTHFNGPPELAELLSPKRLIPF